ncbi:hypothetical protein CKAN_01701200 [Cinnamomum micranthum f. kanehirae]|uniref:Uncharacterized protein n=1 Tax=Cinnamomum micranthum f. kanehirae TaxID=337451 RepID=A0A3S3MQT3_9MAGN|nr:hypothetical protein CKAN_01701200 [Cinnamomum micranthum f. kanehirae]
MVFFCFLVDQKRMVRSSKPAAGICSRCGGGASVADMKTATRDLDGGLNAENRMEWSSCWKSGH